MKNVLYAKPPASLDHDRVCLNVGWQPPSADFLKMNVDGAVIRSSGLAACGGIIQDSN